MSNQIDEVIKKWKADKRTGKIVATINFNTGGITEIEIEEKYKAKARK